MELWNNRYNKRVKTAPFGRCDRQKAAALYLYLYLYRYTPMKKTLFTVFSFVLIVISAPTVACSGDGLNLKFYLPLSQALETYSDQGKSVDQYLKNQFPGIDFIPVTDELEIIHPSEISHVRSGHISVGVPKRGAAPVVTKIEHLHLFIQAEYISCTGVDNKSPLDCKKTTAYRKVGSFQPTPGVTGVSIRLSRSENQVTLIVVATQHDPKSGKQKFLLASKASKEPRCGPEERNIYIQDPLLRDALNRQEYDLKHKAILGLHSHYLRGVPGSLKKSVLTYAEYLQYIEGRPLDSN
jgi:hypothetical protein